MFKRYYAHQLWLSLNSNPTPSHFGKHIMVHAIIITVRPFNDPLITLQLSHVGIAVLIVEITPAAGVVVVIGRRRKLIVQ